ncbi:hypothetical protein [Nocardia nova]|uniref:hypothetical protein n=1 Tax=Nocardia nova TaxID=37330 RepID=UPI0027386446|nr:hypothetical protein [Nocardia nova]
MTEPEKPEGVWMVASNIPYEGITLAIPYPSEVEALRAVNKGVGYGTAHAYFVPYGHDLGEVMKK